MAVPIPALYHQHDRLDNSLALLFLAGVQLDHPDCGCGVLANSRVLARCLFSDHPDRHDKPWHCESRTRRRETHVLLDDLAEAVAEGTRKEFMDEMSSVALLIIDDF